MSHLASLGELFDGMEDELASDIQSRVGSGNTMSGLARQGWKKNMYFETDLWMDKSVDGVICGYNLRQVNVLFAKIKVQLMRPRETEVHARNKVIMWLDRLHNRLGWIEIKKDYRISTASAKIYVDNVLNAITVTFAGTNIISFPNENERKVIVDILKLRGAALPTAIFSFDGKHCRVLGQGRYERLSHKFKFRPCFNALFIIERAFKTVCAFNLDSEAKKHDVKMLYESAFYYKLDKILNGWICLADKAYVNEQLIAAGLKNNNKHKKLYSKSFWLKFNKARGDSEYAFAHFFVNKFKILSNWPGKSADTFDDWALNVTCSIIVYNFFKKEEIVHVLN